jgi:hypothetical protein
VAKDNELIPAFQQESLLSVYLGASYEDGALPSFYALCKNLQNITNTYTVNNRLFYAAASAKTV